MDLISIDNIKKQYMNVLAKDEKYLDILMELEKKDAAAPISSFKSLNPEDVPSYDNEERELQEILLDLTAINNATIEIKEYADSIINQVDAAVESVAKAIEEENARISDINMICGLNSEYNMVIPVYASDFADSESGYETLDDKTIGAELVTNEEVEYSITSLSGNGLPAKTYSYEILTSSGGEYSSNDSYSDISYITDESDITAYDYKRYITTDRSEAIDGIINYDNKEIECVITLKAAKACSKMKLLSETKDLVIKDLETSDDGINWLSRLEKPIKLNNTEAIYGDNSYIYGTGILCFPYTTFVRVTTSSDTILEEKIAVRTGDGEAVPFSNTKSKKIRLNNIKLYSSTYKDTDIESVNLLESGSVDKISLFASEYIPDHFNDFDEYIKFYLIVNGKEHEIVPANSGKSGIRLIKYSEVSNPATKVDGVELIEETIKDARIRISIKGYNDLETPYVSNLKLCLGKDTGSIYV